MSDSASPARSRTLAVALGTIALLAVGAALSPRRWSLVAQAPQAPSRTSPAASGSAPPSSSSSSPPRARGRVEPWAGASGAEVVGLDEAGRETARAKVAPDGSFTLSGEVAPRTAFVEVGGARAGEVTKISSPDAPLLLSMRPLSALRARVVDHDLGVALPARLVVHGRDGTREPNLGPPQRATGAGPLVDAEPGETRLLLPSGKYRVLATRGVEYTVDALEVELSPGQEAEVELRLRHVVATPGWAASDLHVHARGSFDSAVSLEDRVRSLMAAGIDFAVPSEHNRIGGYGTVAIAGHEGWISWVPAVEVTTLEPLRGHFNVFPYEAAEPPRHRRTGLSDLIYFVREKTPGSLIQVNHPRMGNLGHFTAVHLDTESERGLSRLARGFDTVEIYNGFDLAETAKVEGMLAEWVRLLEKGRRHWATGNSDSHAVQYVTVGYPRTYIGVEADHEDGRGAPLDVPALVSAMKRGRAFLTSGPVVEVSQGERGPGEALQVEGGRAKVKVRVRAAPWLDASELEVLVGGRSVLRRPLASAPPRVGRPEGGLEEERARAVRLDEELDVEVPEGSKALVVVVRGGRSVGEVLPFMDFKPMAVSNPLLVEAR